MSKRRVVTLAQDEIDAVNSVLETKTAKRFNMNARDVIRYVLVHCGEQFRVLDNSEADTAKIARSMRAIEDGVLNAMKVFEDLMLRGGSGRKSGAPRANAKLTEDEEMERGLLICEQLGGVRQSHMCFYKKFEVTPAMTVAETEVGLPLATLSEQNLKDQYFPSKEEYERVASVKI